SPPAATGGTQQARTDERHGARGGHGRRTGERGFGVPGGRGQAAGVQDDRHADPAAVEEREVEGEIVGADGVGAGGDAVRGGVGARGGHGGGEETGERVGDVGE